MGVSSLQQEVERIQSLRALEILDRTPAAEFDALAQAAAAACAVPVAAIAFVDVDRVWFKAAVGLAGLCEIPRGRAFCDQTIATDTVFEVQDAQWDARFAASPLVSGAAAIRSYAGVPIRLVDGAAVGTLCVMDRAPRAFDPRARAILGHLAEAAGHLLRARVQIVSARSDAPAQARAQLVLRHSADAIVGVSPERRILHWNHAAERLFGYAEQDALGLPVDELLIPVANEQGVIPAGIFPEHGPEAQDYESLAVCRDGSRIPVMVARVPENDPRNRPRTVLKFIRDLRPERAMLGRLADSEARLRQSLEEFQDLYDHAPCGYHSVGSDGRYLRVNATELAWLGCARDEVEGRCGPADFLGEEGGAAFAEALVRLQASDEAQTLTAVLAGRAGAARDVTIRMSALRDGAGRFLMTRSVVFDVTMLKNTERALHRLNAEQDAILNNELVGITRVRDGRFHWANRGFERMLGYPPGGLDGKSSRVLFPDLAAYDEGRETAYNALREHGVFRGELRLLRLDGTRIWMEVHGRYFDHGSPEVLWLCTDIDARKAAEVALHSSQAFLARAGTIAGIGGWEYDIASQGVFWSDEVCHLYDVPAGHRPGLEEALEYYAPAGRLAINQAIAEAIAHGTPWDLVLPMISAKGRSFWARVVGLAEFEGGVPVRLVGSFQDVTERHELHRALAESHELLRVTLDSIGDAVITTDVHGAIEWLNPVAERLTGWSKDAARGRRLPEVFRILNEDVRTPAADPVAECLAQGQIVKLAGHTILVALDGTEHGIEDSASPIRDEHGKVLGAVLVFHDVSEQRRLSREMHRRATHDSLTDLPNRAEFEARLQQALNSAYDAQAVHALLYVDLDQFKLVNDACGHAVGDDLLRKVGAMLMHQVRSRDTVARIGGDEFALLLEHCDLDQAMRIGGKICEHMEEFPLVHDGRRFRVGASIGLVQVDARWSEIQTLMQAADSACYAAKEAGRNRVRAWLENDHEARVRQGQVEWVGRLEQAMDDNQFVLYGQRIIPLAGPESALHCEVLLRLREADGSCVAPGAFLPAAERFHLMPRIDRWVIRCALDTLGRSLTGDERVGMVSINLSGQSIGDRAFHRELLAMLRGASFDLSRLCFEITETAAITNLVGARNFIEEVRLLGVCIALDDFGAGASSFGYLKNLPVDYLKIDGQFITDLLDDPLDGAAVRSFRDVAQVIGVKTVAEFVERADVCEELRLLGIDMAQGYLIHRPEPLGNLLSRAAEVYA